jgi:hypothetical protein
LGAVRRIRDSAASRDALALLGDLRDHMGDATLAERALKSLCVLVETDEGLADMTREAGGIDTALAALRAHGAKPDIAAAALHVLESTVTNADEATFGACAAAVATEAVVALRRHSDDLAVLTAGCMALSELGSSNRMSAQIWSSSAGAREAVQEAVRCLSAALRAHAGTLDIAVDVLIALGELFCVVAAGTADTGVETGCVELIIAAMHTHRGSAPKYGRLQARGCRALAMICWSSSAPEELDACGSIEAVFEALRRYPEDAPLHAAGFHALFMYRSNGGCRMDGDYDGWGTAVLEAGLAALRRHGRDLDVLDCVFEVLTMDLVMSSEPNNWMLPLLGTPEAAALLKRSAEQLERSGKCYRFITKFVAHMTHGACAGCDELQETKMRLCNRCRHARYCSVECQRKHWPVHKRECVPAPAGAARV